MVLNGFTYFNIFGLPLIVYLGAITFVVLAVTAYTGAKHKPINTHKILATVAIVLALLHGLLAILAYL